MTIKRLKSTGGFTLVEVMATVLILTVAVLGTSGYRYYAALDARKAATHTTAARIGLLLCESWRGVKGIETYDPIAHLGTDLTITTATDPSVLQAQYKDASFTLLGAYTVVENNVTCHAVLSWKDVNTELRLLNVVVAWPPVSQTSPAYTDYYALKSFKLTTYTSK